MVISRHPFVWTSCVEFPILPEAPAHSQIPDFEDDHEPEADGDERLDDLDDKRTPAFRRLEEELDDESTIAGGEEEGA